MKIGDKYKYIETPNGSNIWEIYDFDSVWINLKSDFGNGMVAYCNITPEILMNCYIKMNEDDTLYESDWTSYTVPISGTYRIGNKTITLPECSKVDTDKLFDSGNASFKIECFHDWKEYIGFTESFKYCTKCDKKRDIK